MPETSAASALLTQDLTKAKALTKIFCLNRIWCSEFQENLIEDNQDGLKVWRYVFITLSIELPMITIDGPRQGILELIHAEDAQEVLAHWTSNDYLV